MSLHKFIIDSIARSTLEVFSTMLGVEIAQGEAVAEDAVPAANDGVVSFIGLAGSWAGTGSLSCSPVLACRICTQMLMTETSSVNEDVLDAVAEITNMIVGSVKTDLEGELGPLGLSIPTVVFGRNFRTRSAGSTDWIVLRFQWDGEPLVVKLCLAPNEKTAHILHSTGDPCTLEV